MSIIKAYLAVAVSADECDSARLIIRIKNVQESYQFSGIERGSAFETYGIPYASEILDVGAVNVTSAIANP